MTARPDNPFAAQNVGALYDRGRPFHHARSLARVRALVGDDPVARAVDVACGTGMSSVALADHAASVTGVDASLQMLHAARSARGVSYVYAHAERLPFPAGSFDAVTCCSGVHWFDQSRFFGELHRVLRPGSWVALYDHYFIGKMVDVPEFRDWARLMMETFPLPGRNPMVGDPAAEVPDGFEKLADDFWDDDIAMTRDEFVDYQLSISNFVRAADSGTPRAELRAWLVDSIGPLYDGAATRVLSFLGSITCLRRIP